MPRLDIDSNFGQIANEIHNYSGPATPPPEGHPNSRVCPQCQEITWKLTRHCLFCGVDLFERDYEERRKRLVWRRVKFGLFFCLVGALSISGSRYVPDPFKLWMMGGGVFSMILAVATTKD